MTLTLPVTTACASPDSGSGSSSLSPSSGARRSLAKARSREMIILSAEQLFSTRGWEATTVRDIAAAAFLSTGAVFSNFKDKNDLFREVVRRDVAALSRDMSESPKGATLQEDLHGIFMAGYRHYESRLPLLRAITQVMWSDDGEPVRNLVQTQSVVDLIISRLTGGGDCAALNTAALSARAHLLHDAYRANLTHAIQGNWDLDELARVSKEQIEIVLTGLQ